MFGKVIHGSQSIIPQTIHNIAETVPMTRRGSGKLLEFLVAKTFGTVATKEAEAIVLQAEEIKPQKNSAFTGCIDIVEAESGTNNVRVDQHKKSALACDNVSEKAVEAPLPPSISCGDEGSKVCVTCVPFVPILSDEREWRCLIEDVAHHAHALDSKAKT